jgi:hypothetical protein
MTNSFKLQYFKICPTLYFTINPIQSYFYFNNIIKINIKNKKIIIQYHNFHKMEHCICLTLGVVILYEKMCKECFYGKLISIKWNIVSMEHLE